MVQRFQPAKDGRAVRSKVLALLLCLCYNICIMAWFSRGPRALRKLDEALGSNTREAFSIARSMHPDIYGITVRLGSNPGYLSPAGPLDPGSIEIPIDREFYERQLADPLFSRRLERFKRFFKERSLTFGVAQVGEAILTHEMGHAVEFADTVHEAGGARRASHVYADRLDRDIASLPLGMPTSRAIALGRESIRSFRLQVPGPETDQRWEEGLRANVEAYTQLPTEVNADQIALRVLTRLYPSG